MTKNEEMPECLKKLSVEELKKYYYFCFLLSPEKLEKLKKLLEEEKNAIRK